MSRSLVAALAAVAVIITAVAGVVAWRVSGGHPWDDAVDRCHQGDIGQQIGDPHRLSVADRTDLVDAVVEQCEYQDIGYLASLFGGPVAASIEVSVPAARSGPVPGVTCASRDGWVKLAGTLPDGQRVVVSVAHAKDGTFDVPNGRLAALGEADVPEGDPETFLVITLDDVQYGNDAGTVEFGRDGRDGTITLTSLWSGEGAAMETTDSDLRLTWTGCLEL